MKISKVIVIVINELLPISAHFSRLGFVAFNFYSVDASSTLLARESYKSFLKMARLCWQLSRPALTLAKSVSWTWVSFLIPYFKMAPICGNTRVSGLLRVRDKYSPKIRSKFLYPTLYFNVKSLYFVRFIIIFFL